MTRSVFAGVLATLAVVALVGLYLVAPRLGAAPQPVDCATWLRSPVEGPVRLTDCEIDARYPIFDPSRPTAEDALVAVSVVEPETLEPRALYLYSKSPDLLSWVDQILAFRGDELRHLRYAERHRARLVRVRDLEGVIGPPEGRAAELVALVDGAPSDALVLDETPDESPLQPLGGLLLLLGLLGALAIVLLQRKWTRSSERLSGQARPLTF
ncbi:MAG: hypothetical protein H6719_26515 [Sandaracinaceae bacterium]|nr:hypothetical protein [Sandaracinaceae bacterium]